MTPRARRIYWREVTRKQLLLERKYAKAIKTVLDKKLSEFIDSYKRDRTIGRAELWNDELLNVYRNLYMETVLTFARYQYRRLRTVSQKATMNFNAAWTQVVNEWLAIHGLELVSTVSDNMRDQILELINRQIQLGVEEGYGMDTVTNNILLAIRAYGSRTTFWAERIARTETGRAANIGHMKGAEAHNFFVVKEWIAAKDHRTRRIANKDEFDHWVLDGQQREMEESFYQIGRTGKTASAQQPGDPNAPAAFTINCRCTIAFEGKRDANGRLIKKQ